MSIIPLDAVETGKIYYAKYKKDGEWTEGFIQPYAKSGAMLLFDTECTKIPGTSRWMCDSTSKVKTEDVIVMYRILTGGRRRRTTRRRAMRRRRGTRRA